MFTCVLNVLSIATLCVYLSNLRTHVDTFVFYTIKWIQHTCVIQDSFSADSQKQRVGK